MLSALLNSLGRLALCLLACGASAGSADELDALLRPDPRLPGLASIEAVGATLWRGIGGQRAQRPAWEAYHHSLMWVDELERRPLDQIQTRWLAVSTYALAHCWGRTQLVLDFLRRYEALVEAGSDPRDRMSAAYAVLRAMRSASHGIADTDSDKYDRLAGAVRAARKLRYAGVFHVGLLLEEVYAVVGDRGDTLAAIARTRSRLLEESERLQRWIRPLLQRARPRMLNISPEAVQILETKAARQSVRSLPSIAPTSPESGRVAEADGNRTRRERVAALPIGFEVRAGHQHRERFRRRL